MLEPLQCCANHNLQLTDRSSAGRCNGCNSELTVDDSTHRCQGCDFDLCAECAKKKAVPKSFHCDVTNFSTRIKVFGLMFQQFQGQESSSTAL